MSKLFIYTAILAGFSIITINGNCSNKQYLQDDSNLYNKLVEYYNINNNSIIGKKHLRSNSNSNHEQNNKYNDKYYRKKLRKKILEKFTNLNDAFYIDSSSEDNNINSNNIIPLNEDDEFTFKGKENNNINQNKSKKRIFKYSLGKRCLYSNNGINNEHLQNEAQKSLSSNSGYNIDEIFFRNIQIYTSEQLNNNDSYCNEINKGNNYVNKNNRKKCTFKNSLGKKYVRLDNNDIK